MAILSLFLTWTFFISGQCALAFKKADVQCTFNRPQTGYFRKHEHIGQRLVIGFSKTLLNHVDGVIVPTEKTKRILEGYGIKEEIQVVPNGIELDAFKKHITIEEKNALKENIGISYRRINGCN